MSEIKLQMNGSSLFSQDSYSFKFLRVGQEHCSVRKKHEKRTREYFSLHFVFHGAGLLCYKDKTVQLNKGSVFLLYAGEEYEYYPDICNPWSYTWIDFYGEDIDEVLELCGFSKEKPYLRCGDISNVKETLKLLMDCYDASDVQQLSCSAYFLVVLSQLIYLNKSFNTNHKEYIKFKQLREILIYINNNYRMNLTLEQICEDTYVSVKQLLNLFNLFVGMTPINYINRFKISYACKMLKEQDAKISQIAEMVGVSDDKYFARLFKQWKGMSPTEYREKVTGDDPFDWLKEKNIDFR